MNKLKVVLLFAAIISCTGTACQKKIKATSFIVGPTRSIFPGISEHGKLQWVTLNGPDFVVHFYSGSPCVGGKNDIVGKKDAPAVCTILPGKEGLLKFAILAPGEPAFVEKFPVLAQIDYCRGCGFVRPIPNPNPYGPPIPNPPLVPIDCEVKDSKSIAVAKPVTLSVYAGQQILWGSVGVDATTQWQVVVPTKVCKEGTTFGTINQQSPVSCTVSSEATVGATYPYTLTYTSTAPPQSCQGEANLMITAPPQ